MQVGEHKGLLVFVRCVCWVHCAVGTVLKHTYRIGLLPVVLRPTPPKN